MAGYPEHRIETAAEVAVQVRDRHGKGGCARQFPRAPAPAASNARVLAMPVLTVQKRGACSIMYGCH